MNLDEATRKAKVLIEALPFLKQFHHQYMVVKLGGTPIEDEVVLDSLLTDLVWLEQVGVRPILVHGGGTRISKAMEEAGLEPEWHEGRRVTDSKTMAIVQREVEALNMHLVNRILELDGAAIGLVPPRHCVVSGTQLDKNIGLVGKPGEIDAARMLRYASRGLIPVVPPLSVDEDGTVYNTNADDIALAIAQGMRVGKLVFCSTVAGVCTDADDPSTLISTLSPAEVRKLVADEIIQGGMIPKVESCLAALESGVDKIHIVNAEIPHALLLEIFTKEGIGTQICSDAQSSSLYPAIKTGAV